LAWLPCRSKVAPAGRVSREASSVRVRVGVRARVRVRVGVTGLALTLTCQPVEVRLVEAA